MTFRDLLRERIEAEGGFAVAAEKLGCTREHLYSLCSPDGGSKISIDLAAAIDTLYGIAMAEWAIERGAA
jgi:hypothetical protein